MSVVYTKQGSDDEFAKIDLSNPEAQQGMADYLASDPGVAAAAEAAVDDAIAGKDLVEVTDPGVVRQVDTLSVGGLTLTSATLTSDDRFVEGVQVGGTPLISRELLLNGGTRFGASVSKTSWAITMSDGTGTYNGSEVVTEIQLGEDGNVPQRVLDRWASRMGLIASQAPIDIWIFAGQSNATKRSSLPVTLYTDTPKIVRWGGASWATETGVPWFGSGVCRGWLTRDADATNRRSGMLEAAVGSTGFSSTASTNGHWNHGVVGTGPDLATALVTKTNSALAAAPLGSRIMGIIWSQCEQDRGMTSSAYTTALDDFISWVRGQLGLPNLPFILSPTTPILSTLSPASGGTDVRNADIEDTPRRVANTSVLLEVPDDSEGTPGDGIFGIHWTPEAQHRRGRSLILGTRGDSTDSAYDIALMNRSDSAPRTPQGLRATRSGTQVIWTWMDAASRIDHFVLETSVDSGSNWVTQTLTAPTTHRHTMTVTVGNPVWGRISAVCSTGTSLTSTEVHA